MTRREFLAAPLAAAAPGRLPVKKAVLIGMLPKTLSYAERFRLAREVGFEQVECVTTPDEREAEEIRKAAEAARVRIHSVMNQTHWKMPLSTADPAVLSAGLKGMETSLRNANFWGADTVLLVPAVVNPETSYRQAWDRSTAQIRKLLPLAAQLRVIIGIENVWNKFLLSPLEFNAYVDQFQSPWVQAYFDVGNVVLTGYPQDWIRTLGKRIAKLHLKDFRFENGKAEWVPLREGQIDWRAVHDALGEAGFAGTATVELPGGEEPYLREVSRRVDLILSGG